MTPAVSIILPTKNGARYLPEALDAIWAQTFRDFELIVVDDGSTDATPAILAACADPRLRVVRHPVNQGIVASLNHGFSESRGHYLTWTSDDDHYAPQAMAVLAAALDANAGLDMVYARYNNMDPEGKEIGPGRVRPPEELDEDNGVGGCFLYRRRVYETIGGYNPDAFLVEDYEYWLRVRARFRMKMLDADLYRHRLHPSSLTMTHRVEEIQDKVHLVRKPYVAAWKYASFEAERARRRGDLAGLRRSALQAVMQNPLYYPSWRLLAFGFLPAGVIQYLRKPRSCAGSADIS